jgi:hypothetical protein
VIGSSPPKLNEEHVASSAASSPQNEPEQRAQSPQSPTAEGQPIQLPTSSPGRSLIKVRFVLQMHGVVAFVVNIRDIFVMLTFSRGMLG